MKKTMLVLLVFSCLLAACGPSSGIVTDRAYQPEWVENIQICPNPGKEPCTMSPVYHPARWALYVVNSDAQAEGWVEVTEALYAVCFVDMYYNNGTCQ